MLIGLVPVFVRRRGLDSTYRDEDEAEGEKDCRILVGSVCLGGATDIRFTEEVRKASDVLKML